MTLVNLFQLIGKLLGDLWPDCHFIIRVTKINTTPEWAFLSSRAKSLNLKRAGGIINDRPLRKSLRNQEIELWLRQEKRVIIVTKPTTSPTHLTHRRMPGNLRVHPVINALDLINHR